MKNYKYSKGFTLIELLVVVAIIGILAAIVYAPLQTALRKGRDAKRVSEMKTLQADLMLYADSNNGQYPPDLQTLKNNIGDSSGFPTAAILSGTTPDLTKYNYTVYYTTNNGNNYVGYHLWTHLETPSSALTGASMCAGYTGGSTVTPTPSNGKCYGGSVSVGSIPDTGTGAYFTGLTDPTTNTNFKDSDCAGNNTKCIYDIKG